MAYRRWLLYKATTALWSLAASCREGRGGLREAGPPETCQTPPWRRAPLLRTHTSVTVPVAKILKYFPPMPATCTPGSPGPPEAVSCGPRECGSHLQLPLESGHLATQGRHLGAVRGCRPALQRLFKTDDLLGELRDLQRGGGVSSCPGPTAGDSGESSRTGLRQRPHPGGW